METDTYTAAERRALMRRGRPAPLTAPIAVARTDLRLLGELGASKHYTYPGRAGVEYEEPPRKRPLTDHDVLPIALMIEEWIDGARRYFPLHEAPAGTFEALRARQERTVRIKPVMPIAPRFTGCFRRTSAIAALGAIASRPDARGFAEMERRALAKGFVISLSADKMSLIVRAPGGVWDPDIASQNRLLVAALAGTPLVCVGGHAEPVNADVVDAYGAPWCKECVP